MKQVTIIGVGMGPRTVTAEGLDAILNAELIMGAPRMLALFPAEKGQTAHSAYAPEAVRAVIRASGLNRFAVLVSGDTGFFSAAQGLTAALDRENVSVLPGISSLSCLFARLKKPWQDAAVISCHGREANIADTVRRNALTFALTGGNINALAKALTQAGYSGLPLTLAENLGAEDERIRVMTVEELTAAQAGSLAVMLIENPQADARIRFGIPDEEFIRGEVPMTKAEVRAVILSRLALSPGDVCADIGAGTGSVTVEMALAAHRGRVYALDHKAEAIDLVCGNCRRFHIGNVHPLLGKAPQALDDLPPLDAAFIGGSSGAMEGIFKAILDKNPRARLVVSAIALESLDQAIRAFGAHGLEPDITQLGVARAKRVAGLHMMMSQNPIFILSGGGSHA